MLFAPAFARWGLKRLHPEHHTRDGLDRSEDGDERGTGVSADIIVLPEVSALIATPGVALRHALFRDKFRAFKIKQHRVQASFTKKRSDFFIVFFAPWVL